MALAVLSSATSGARSPPSYLPGTLARALPPGGFRALYVGASEWIMLSIPSIHLRIEGDIRSAALEAHLLRPKPYLVLRIAESLGDMLARMAVLAPVALALLLVSGRAASPEGIVWLAVSGVFGGAIGVLLYALVGLAGVLLGAAHHLPAFLIVQKLMFILGGLFAPVSLYPGLLRRLSEASPFAAQLYWPAIQLVAPSARTFEHALALQAVWLALLSLLAAALWRLGVRKLLREDLTMGGIFSTYPPQAWAAIRASLAGRTSFLLQAGGMAVNNGFFLALWVLFFAGFKSVGGWGGRDMALLLGLIMTIVGVAGVAFGGYRDMAAAILGGEIDSLLTQPKSVLAGCCRATAWPAPGATSWSA